MTSEEINTALYEKMFAAQENYREWLLSLPPGEVLNHAYEYIHREDILLSLECRDLSAPQAKALLKSKDPLNDIFTAWEKRESSYMDELWDTIESRANAVIRMQKRDEPER